MKESLWTGGFALAVLLLFFVFVANGWPGDMDSCISDNDAKKPSVTDNTCYCEPFDIKDVKNHLPGVRQPFNTFSNLYALGTGAFLVFTVWKQRRKREDSNDPEVRNPTKDKNRFRIGNFYPIFYIQVALFLGLGSMFFHASIVNWGGIFDQMSMYTLVSFLIAYSLVRLRNVDRYFYICYPLLVFLFFVLALLHVSSVIIILLALLGPYAVLEFIIFFQDWVFNKNTKVSFWVYSRYWIIGFTTFMIAIVIRGASDTGGPLCISCSSAFQYHGVWHWLSGITALMLYFHWKKAQR